MSPNTETVASRIDADSKAQLALAAEECGTSMSAYLELAIEDHIERNPWDLRALASNSSSGLTETDCSQQDEPKSNFIEQLLGDLE
ncbi:hypothetical protein LPA44_09630 [Halobacterium sp. KA-4]|uniref:hypothetical protein n=1 Tax=Halobacterium sp. KA-4 TaxID=2896367 RepID=UPI001E4DEDC7|nr:hypothetical protein [Halobacterium sp. KA-4]MCD2200159.1 hypothetical protein [Halobacterium sp. KA-4]